MRILGVDPGASGALAVIDGTARDVIELDDMPVGKIMIGKTAKNRISPEILGLWLRDVMPLDVAYVEEVGAMPRQGVSSVFTFGQAHGLILGAIASLGVRMVRVRPQLWQKTVKAAQDPRLTAVALYPGMASQLKRVKDKGRADALLIAHYGLITENEQ